MTNGINFSSMDISASGLTAERMRMDIVASNIANARTTVGENGEPYRRKQVVFASAFNNTLSHFGSGSPSISGVRITQIREDQSDFPLVYIPGHPQADEKGMVAMPNVSLPNEMVDMISASRSYEANLKAIQSFRQMAEQTLAILRGIG